MIKRTEEKHHSRKIDAQRGGKKKITIRSSLIGGGGEQGERKEGKRKKCPGKIYMRKGEREAQRLNGRHSY